jgi:hypothetical protein
VRQVGHLPELYRDARSTKHKKKESQCFYCGVGFQFAYSISVNVVFESPKIVNYDFSYNAHIKTERWMTGLNDAHLDIFSS